MTKRTLFFSVFLVTASVPRPLVKPISLGRPDIAVSTYCARPYKISQNRRGKNNYEPGHRFIYAVRFFRVHTSLQSIPSINANDVIRYACLHTRTCARVLTKTLLLYDTVKTCFTPVHDVDAGSSEFSTFFTLLNWNGIIHVYFLFFYKTLRCCFNRILKSLRGKNAEAFDDGRAQL